MAITTRLIGKLGGADVQKTPVSIVADGGENSRAIIHTVHVPEGETWLVALAGDLDPARTTSLGPELFIGKVSIGPNLPAGHTSIAAEVTGTAEITLNRNASSGSDSFVGQVYTAPLP